MCCVPGAIEYLPGRKLDAGGGGWRNKIILGPMEAIGEETAAYITVEVLLIAYMDSHNPLAYHSLLQVRGSFRRYKLVDRDSSTGAV